MLDCVKQLLDMGCYEVSLGDTVGTGVPADVERLLSYLLEAGIDAAQLAGHFHDTYGQALANVWAAFRCGVRVFDSSIAGLGGCPYAPGAKGNLATEDLVYSLHQAGVPTGVNLVKLVSTGTWISDALSLPTSSRAASALAVKSSTPAPPFKASKPSPLQWIPQQSPNGIELFGEGATLKIVLNRPRNGNALTLDMIASLTDIFRTASSDSSISRIVIAARGKFFCTGMDLGKAQSPVAKGGSVADAQYLRLLQLFEAIDKAPQVTIAVAQGPAFGGGVGLFLCCDIRIMGHAAAIQLSEVRLGLAPATIAKYVVRELGVSLARELMLSARVVGASELLRLGKIALVVEDSQDLSLALDEYLVKLKECAPKASKLCKEVVRLLSDDEANAAKQKEAGIRAVFASMMSPDSESSYGLRQFQQGNRKLNWDAHMVTKMQKPSKL